MVTNSVFHKIAIENHSESSLSGIRTLEGNTFTYSQQPRSITIAAWYVHVPSRFTRQYNFAMLHAMLHSILTIRLFHDPG